MCKAKFSRNSKNSHQLKRRAVKGVNEAQHHRLSTKRVETKSCVICIAKYFSQKINLINTYFLMLWEVAFTEIFSDTGLVLCNISTPDLHHLLLILFGLSVYEISIAETYEVWQCLAVDSKLYWRAFFFSKKCCISKRI